MRPPRTSDVAAILAAMRKNQTHLKAWSPLRTGADAIPSLATVARDVSIARRSWRRDEAYTFFLFDRRARADGATRRADSPAERVPTRSSVIGRVTLGRVLRGPFQNSFLGYWIDDACQRLGLMTEAVAAAVRFAFLDIDLHRVQASIMPRNVASRKVVEKLGFREEGVSLRYLQIAGKWEDHVIYALTRDEWRAS